MSLKTHYNWLDRTNERTRTQLYFEDIAANGSNYPTLFAATTGKIDLVRLALDAATDLNETTVTASIEAHQAVESTPTAAGAHRELALRVTYVDNVTGDKGRFDIPGPAAAIQVEGTDIVPLSNVAFAALIAVIEANCVSRLGNAITVNSGKLVGRRS